MAKKIYVLNGPNMNMLGIREPHLYGKTTLKDVEALCAKACSERGYEMEFRQSNHEGDLIDWLHEAHAKKISGIVINPGGHTSTSISLLDAVKSIGPLPVIEIHISHVHQREEWRQWSYIGHGVKASLCGFGVNGYVLAISGLVSMLEQAKD
jgi:3-dehydroquinate dehydratase-2